MRTLLSLLALVFLLPTHTQAAITVGPGGSGIISFPALPSVSEWGTRSLAGSETTFGTAAALDAAVQTNRAATITNTLLDGLGAVPPGQNTLTSWSGGGATALWTRPAANSATLLMAALQNNTGEDQTVAGISYTLGQSGTTPVEQASAHEVFYSLTGEAGTWVKIPELSGGAPGARRATVLLNGAWLNGATLYVLWADDNTTGGVDRGYSLDDVVFTGRPPPTLQVIPDVVAEVLRPVFFRVLGSNTVPGAQIIYSLDAAPAGARINSTNGFLVWQPTRAHAASTNLLTVRATDASASSASATQSFTIIVRDYVELSLSRVVMRGGERTNVLLEAATTVALTNLSVTVRLPSDRLTAPVVENLVPSLANMSVDGAQPGQLALNFSALPGQWMTGTQTLARVTFTAEPALSSAFVPLQLAEPVVARAVPGLAPSLLLNHGRAVVVNREPLVEALRTDGARTLTLFGHAGTNYTIETAPGPLGPWLAGTAITLSTLFTTLNANEGVGAPVIFYRAREGAGPPPSLNAATPASTEAPAPSKQVKKPKKKRIPASRRTKAPVLVSPAN